MWVTVAGRVEQGGAAVKVVEPLVATFRDADRRIVEGRQIRHAALAHPVAPAAEADTDGRVGRNFWPA